jgi:hypothetical protein
MKPRYWWIFGCAQVVGTVVGMGAAHVDHLSWGISLVLLLPGTLVSLPFFTEGHIGNNWPKWTIFAIAVTANLICFVLVSVVVGRRRRSS